MVHNMLEMMMEEGLAVGAGDRARTYHGSLLVNFTKTGANYLLLINCY